MAILIDEKKRVLVQGITGREGRARTRLMREYGTNVVGGVTPGKGGQSVPDEKRSFSQNPELAAEAGRKGGQASHGGGASSANPESHQRETQRTEE